MKLELKKYVAEGCAIPRFYGCAYRDFARFAYVCYPIPLNLFVAIWHLKILPRLKGPLYDEVEEARLMAEIRREAYEKGAAEGRRVFKDVQDFVMGLSIDETMRVYSLAAAKITECRLLLQK